MSKSIYHQAAVTIHDCNAVSPLSVEEIERIIADNTVTETAWRGAFGHIAKQLGVKPNMKHCSDATFSVLKALEHRSAVTQILLKALQKAYRKHVKDDANIGWTEIDSLLESALTTGMGDEAFCEWLALLEAETNTDR